jgi:hypothetical protein
MSPLRILLLVGVGCLVLASSAGADGTPLNGSVGPGFTITLRDGSGASVSHLDPGSFTLVVDDKSSEHDFHLQGPGGVDVSTDIDAIGTKTFNLNLVDGQYTFICDAHPTTMGGVFAVGTATGGGGSGGGGSGGGGTGGGGSTTTKLVLTVTGQKITLTTPAGKKVTKLPVGVVSITVKDRSATRGVKLRGAGITKSTTTKFVGTVVWKGKLASGTLLFAGTPTLAGGKVLVG